MNFIKKHSFLLLFIIITAGILASAFFMSPSPAHIEAPTQTNATPAPVYQTPQPSQVSDKTPAPVVSPTPSYQEPESSVPPEKSTVPTAAPTPSPTPSAVSEKNLTCTLSVRCNTVLNNIANLNPEKLGIIPPNGILFPETELEFTEGESVFDVLLRAMKDNKIHLEFVNVPMYNSTYIEGIGNIYEFDCGELSGWMYRVNGSFPNYGCSRYIIKPGDKIEWIYTCDLGKDIGGENISQNQ